MPKKKEGEGFYLPALQAMALGSIVICRDCIGNRSFCLPGHNCICPKYNTEALLSAFESALELTSTPDSQMLANTKQTVAKYSLFKERQAF